MKFKLNIPIYDHEILMLIGESPASAAKHYRKYSGDASFNSEHLNKNGAVVHRESDAWYMALFVRCGIRAPAFHGVLSHEIFHAASTILDYRGVDYSPKGSNEPFSYLIEFLTTQTYKKIKRFK